MAKGSSGAGGWTVVGGGNANKKKATKATAASSAAKKQQEQPRSVGDILQAAIRSSAAVPVASQVADSRTGRRSNLSAVGGAVVSGRSAAAMRQTAALDPFASPSIDAVVPRRRRGGGANIKQQQQQHSSSGGATESEDAYVSPAELLRRGNSFFSARTKQERKLAKVAAEKIEEMKRVNKKGGDRNGFKYVIPKSVKKLAQRMAGDVEVNDAEAINDETARRLLPASTSTVVGGSEGDQGTTTGLRDDDRPMRRKKPREAKERTDFYAWQKWKKWTENAENFLSRGRLNRRMFDSKRKFRSV